MIASISILYKNTATFRPIGNPVWWHLSCAVYRTTPELEQTEFTRLCANIKSITTMKKTLTLCLLAFGLLASSASHSDAAIVKKHKKAKKKKHVVTAMKAAPTNGGSAAHQTVRHTPGNARSTGTTK
jgi:hypothetical protein